MKRIVSRSGKNKIYINGNLATLANLSSLSETMVNVCSQHEHQAILNADHHIDIIDEFGELMPLRNQFSLLYRNYCDFKEYLNELELKNRNKLDREEFLQFQLKEIIDAHITSGEDTTLLEEKRILRNAKELSEHARNAHDILYAGEYSVLEVPHDAARVYLSFRYKSIFSRFQSLMHCAFQAPVLL